MEVPLHIDDEVENSAQRSAHGWFTAFLRRFTDVTKLRFFYEVPRGRRSVELQLRERKSFPEAQWRIRGYRPDVVIPVLEIIRQEMGWPNCNFIPEDNLNLLLTIGYDELSLEFLIISLNRIAQNKIDNIIINKYCEKCLYEFIDIII